MKLAMIGCGNFARQLHGPAQRRCADRDSGLVLAACCDMAADRAREYAAAFGFARSYADAAAMLAAERPDAVIMAVPPPVTAEAASQVLALGFPLLLEKPPGLTAAELERLIAAADRGRARAQVGFNRRHMPVVREARRILAESFAAAPIVNVDYAMLRYDRWDADFSTTAVHAIDAVRHLAGSAFLRARLAYQPMAAGGRETVAVEVDLDCESGARVRLTIQPAAGYNTETARLHAVGQSLLVTIPFPGRRLGDGTVEHWRGDELVAQYSDGGAAAEEKMGVVAETEAFLSAVSSGAALAPGLRDCRQQVALMEAMRQRRTAVDFIPQP